MRYGKNRAQYPTYLCDKSFCVARKASVVDAYVITTVLNRIATNDSATIVAGDDTQAAEAMEQAGVLDAQLRLAADEFIDGAISTATLGRIEQTLRPKIDAARARAQSSSTSPELADLVGADDVFSRWWTEMPVSAQRAVVRAMCVTIVEKTNRGTRTFRLESASFQWRR